MSLRVSRRLSTVSTQSALYALSVEELRTRLQKDVLRRCAPSDAQRALKDDWWLMTFLVCYNGDVDVTYSVVAECLKWRHNQQVEHIGLLSVKELLDRKLMFLRGSDVEGNSVLRIRMREHTNGLRETEQLFIFWIERHFMETRGAPLTILVDMTNTSLLNLDYNLFKFILNLLKFYYPNCVQDMVVFECPSMLQSSWKVIKSWITAGHPQIHLVTRDSITHFIPSSSLPPHMGGQDEWEFSMEEVAQCLPSRVLTQEIVLDKEDAMNNSFEFPQKRNVTFESEDEVTTRRAPLVISGPNVRRPSRGASSRRSLPTGLRLLAERRVHAPSTDWATTSYLSICPKEELNLSPITDCQDLVDIVAIRNHSSSPLIFKIKTTSPEKFRVRPSAGRIGAGTTEVVRVYLQSEYKMTAAREKFLVMTLLSNENNLDAFAQLWNEAAEESKTEYKLRCRVPDDDTLSSISRDRGEDGTEVDKLRLQVDAISSTHKILFLLIVVVILMQFACLFNERSNSSSIRSALDAIAAAKRDSDED